LTRNQGFRHAAPEEIHHRFTNTIIYTENEFIDLVSLIKPTILDDIYDSKQYWIRYLMCCGLVNNVTCEFNKIVNHDVDGVNIEDFY